MRKRIEFDLARYMDGHSGRLSIMVEGTGKFEVELTKEQIKELVEVLSGKN